MSVLDLILKQHEDNSKRNTSVDKKPVDLTKYFVDKLMKGELSGDKTFRILPAKDGSPFVEAYFHQMKVGEEYKKLYCKKRNDGGHCPLCEAEEKLKKTGTKENIDASREYQAKKFYVIKGIDRASEHEGVKFWRFPHNFKGDGIFDKIVAIIKKRGNIFDTETGRDINLSLGRDDKSYSKISAILPEDVSPLHLDKDKANLWLSNDETYRDVYKPANDDYLNIIASGDTPVWDRDLKKLVPKSTLDAAVTTAPVTTSSVIDSYMEDKIGGNSTPVVIPDGFESYDENNQADSDDLPF